MYKLSFLIHCRSSLQYLGCVMAHRPQSLVSKRELLTLPGVEKVSLGKSSGFTQCLWAWKVLVV